EAMGMALPGASSVPAVDAAHQRLAAQAGRRAVEMMDEDLRPTRILSRKSFLNAIAVAMAMGCSTNAIIHVIALARRAGHSDIGLDEFDQISRKVPVIANIRPNGDSRYLMEDFYYAGGLPALMHRLQSCLHTEEMTVTGRPLSHNFAHARVYNDDVIRTLEQPVYAEGALAV